MREFSSLADLARQFQRVNVALSKEIDRSLEEIGKYVTTVAQAKIGDQQPSVSSPQGEGFPLWEPLKDETEAEKVALGYAAGEPLLREGDMRDSIGFEVSGTYEAEAVTVGATDKKAEFHEFGTASIPPRPFLGAAMAQTMNENIDTLMHGVERAFKR